MRLVREVLYRVKGASNVLLQNNDIFTYKSITRKSLKVLINVN